MKQLTLGDVEAILKRNKDKGCKTMWDAFDKALGVAIKERGRDAIVEGRDSVEHKDVDYEQR